MGSRYRKEFEREWEGKSCNDIKLKMVMDQADRNLSKVGLGKVMRRLKK